MFIEGRDYFLHYIKFANRANPCMTAPNDDGTFDVYLNTLYTQEELAAELKHELRHLEEDHFYSEKSIRAIEAEADGRPLEKIIAPPGKIVYFPSEAALADLITAHLHILPPHRG